MVKWWKKLSKNQKYTFILGGIIIPIILGLILKDKIINNLSVINSSNINYSVNSNNLTTLNNPVYIDNSVVSLDFGLDKNKKDFCDTIKNKFNCRQDEGIYCDVLFLNVLNPFDTELKNVQMLLEVENKKYELFLNKLDNNIQLVGYCTVDKSICTIAPQYLPENNTNKEICNQLETINGRTYLKSKECDY